MSDHDTNEHRAVRPGMNVPTVIFALLVLAGGVLFQNVIWSGGADNVNTYYERHASEDWQSRQQANRLGINQLKPGVNLVDAVSKLGAPDFRDGYGEDGSVEVLYYRTRRVADDGVTNKWQETSPLVFVEGRLVSQGVYTVDGSDRVRVMDANWFQRQEFNNGYIGALPLDNEVALTQVLEDLGQPEFSERVGDHIDILFYRTHSDLDDQHTDKRTETRPLVFAGGILIARDFSTPGEMADGE